MGSPAIGDRSIVRYAATAGPGWSTRRARDPTATLTTNVGGSGKAQAFLLPEDAGMLPDGTHGTVWPFAADGTPARQTDRPSIVLD
jgi:hypothetical protein